MLPRLSKLQHIVAKKVAEEYGYLYPYIPTQLEEEIQEKRVQWVDAAIRSFLKIPLHVEFEKLSPRYVEKYTNVYKYGLVELC